MAQHVVANLLAKEARDQRRRENPLLMNEIERLQLDWENALLLMTHPETGKCHLVLDKAGRMLQIVRKGQLERQIAWRLLCSMPLCYARLRDALTDELCETHHTVA